MEHLGGQYSQIRINKLSAWIAMPQTHRLELEGYLLKIRHTRVINKSSQLTRLQQQDQALLLACGSFHKHL